ncbi:fructosamine kinase family protein, partial [Streptomyces sp. S1A]|uniref:fructosamine kinase family protein n=1 Tax=Streptomyces sp. ICN903 TaxID=2964654 RepID=UPI001EDC6F7D
MAGVTGGPGRSGEGVAGRVAALTGSAPGQARPVGGGDICDAYRIELADGRTVFAKTLAGAPRDFFAAEAAGLELLRSTGAVAVPEVIGAEADVLVLEWVEPGAASAGQAERLGRELAALHSSPAPVWGGTDPALPVHLGSVPLP